VTLLPFRQDVVAAAVVSVSATTVSDTAMMGFLRDTFDEVRLFEPELGRKLTQNVHDVVESVVLEHVDARRDLHGPAPEAEVADVVGFVRRQREAAALSFAFVVVVVEEHGAFACVLYGLVTARSLGGSLLLIYLGG
jgi:hypothetical protein